MDSDKAKPAPQCVVCLKQLSSECMKPLFEIESKIWLYNETLGLCI